MSDRVLFVGLAALLALAIIGSVFAALHEQEQWDAFARQHNCKLIGHMRGDVSTGIGFSSGGNMVVTTNSTPDKKGYACDDGKQYWR